MINTSAATLLLAIRIFIISLPRHCVSRQNLCMDYEKCDLTGPCACQNSNNNHENNVNNTKIRTIKTKSHSYVPADAVLFYPIALR